MNHLEAQSYIMPFIEDKIPEAKQEDFVLHMNSCPKCREELEIYYTLMVGMKQIDSKQEIATDFSSDLALRLKKLEHHLKGRKRRKFSAFSIVIAGLVAAIFVFYGRALVKVYDFEQDRKLKSQGNYYFHRELDDTILLSERDRVNESAKLIAEPKVSIFRKIDVYRDIKSHIDDVDRIGIDIFDDREITTEEGNDEKTSAD